MLYHLSIPVKEHPVKTIPLAVCPAEDRFSPAIVLPLTNDSVRHNSFSEFSLLPDKLNHVELTSVSSSSETELLGVSEGSKKNWD